MKKCAIGVVLAAMAGAGPAFAQIGRGDAPVYVEANRGDLLRNECRGVYSGDVVATQGDARLTTDKLTLQGSRPDSPNAQCEAERLIAEANVLYNTPKLRIRSERAEYDSALEAITFTGDVVLASDDGGLMRGTSLVYSLTDERARITAGNNRVQVIIPPPKRDTDSSPN